MDLIELFNFILTAMAICSGLVLAFLLVIYLMAQFIRFLDFLEDFLPWLAGSIEKSNKRAEDEFWGRTSEVDKK